MSERLTGTERRVLKAANGQGEPEPWGAAIGVAIESLIAMRYLEPEFHERRTVYLITPAGRAALGEKEGDAISQP